MGSASIRALSTLIGHVHLAFVGIYLKNSFTFFVGSNQLRKTLPLDFAQLVYFGEVFTERAV